jgi:hypothetical protein
MLIYRFSLAKHLTAMTRAIITPELIAGLTPRPKLFDITGIGFPGFGCRILPSGRKYWFYRFRRGASVRMVNLGWATWISLHTALSRYKRYKNRKDAGEDVKGPNVNAEEADYLLIQLYEIFDFGRDLPIPVRNEPTIEEFADHFRVHPASVKKLAGYNLLKCVKRDDAIRVIAYPRAITTFCHTGRSFI